MTPSWQYGRTGSLILLAALACAHRTPPAEVPEPGRSVFDRIIREQVGGESPGACPRPDPRGDLTLRSAVSARVSLAIPEGYRYREPLREIENPRHNRWFPGPFWIWRSGVSLETGPTWIRDGGEGSDLLVQVRDRRGYIAVGPGPGMRFGALRECLLPVAEASARVLLFEITLEGAPPLYYGVAAQWRALGSGVRVSLLGLGTGPEVQARYLAMVSGSR